ncbi:hypothetical protein IWW48_002821 [Coemansia sp. RSA 1200]|nr:hypothetical protein IWW48_002821 [Coemansia sp. RSA 1200]
MSVSLDKKHKTIEESHYWQATMHDVIRVSGQRFARKVYLNIPLSQLINGGFQKLISLPPYRDSVFSNVLAVSLKLFGSNLDGELADAELLESIDMLAQQIKTMFPNGKQLQISSTVLYGSGLPQTIRDYFDILISKLMSGITGLVYYTQCERFAGVPLPQVTGLVNITYTECGNPDPFLQLIFNNRDTLKSINLELSAENTLARMFSADRYQLNKEKQNAVVVFERLERLRIICYEYDHVQGTKIHIHGAPFPNLKRLTFYHPYIFAGDILFRGNYDKLEYLKLSLDSEGIERMFVDGIFRAERFRALLYIGMDINLRHQTISPEFGKQLCHVLWNLAPRRQNLSVNLLSFPYKEMFIQELATSTVCDMVTQKNNSNNKEHQSLESIKYLSIGSLDLDIHETIQILSHLPNLSQLKINPKTMDTNKPWYLQDFINAEYIDSAFRQFHPLAPCLRHVLFDLAIYSDMEGASHFAAILAILCPKVDSVRWGMASSAFEDCCQATVASKAYSKHSERLGLVDWLKGS